MGAAQTKAPRASSAVAPHLQPVLASDVWPIPSLPSPRLLSNAWDGPSRSLAGETDSIAGSAQSRESRPPRGRSGTTDGSATGGRSRDRPWDLHRFRLEPAGATLGTPVRKCGAHREGRCAVPARLWRRSCSRSATASCSRSATASCSRSATASCSRSATARRSNAAEWRSRLPAPAERGAAGETSAGPSSALSPSRESTPGVAAVGSGGSGAPEASPSTPSCRRRWMPWAVLLARVSPDATFRPSWSRPSHSILVHPATSSGDRTSATSLPRTS
jgi:hypothetical protein